MQMPAFFSRTSTYWALAGVAILVFGGWYFFFRNKDGNFQTLVVRPTTFAERVSVSGTVESAQNVDLGFAASGRISGVYARVGEEVPEGALLAQVENGDLRATVAQKEAALASQQATLDSLKAGTRPEQLAVTQAQVDSDQVAITEDKLAVFNAIENAYTQADDAVHNKADQFFNGPRTASPQISFSTSDSALAANLNTERAAVEGLLTTWQKDVFSLIATQDLTSATAEAKNNLSTVAQFLSDSNATLNTAIPTSAVSAATISGWVSNIATARANVNTAQTSLTSAVTTLTVAQATLNKDQKNLALEQAGSTSQSIEEQEALVAAAQADVGSARAQLTKTIVSAPFDGTVTRMDAKVGEIVSPTTPQISMISHGLFQIAAYVPEVEIAGLSVGDSATVTLDAYGPDTPFTAKIITIDPAETVNNGVSTYKTTLQFNTTDMRIKSGMTASVIITAQASPNALVVPQGAVFQKSSGQLVQVVRGGSIIDTPVQTGGAGGLGNVQVISGLKSGDVVVLNPDTSR